MKSKTSLLLAAGVALALTAGCMTQPGPYAPVDTTKYNLESTGTFVLLDKPTQFSVTGTGIQERTLDDGRIEIVVNLKNRESRRIQV